MEAIFQKSHYPEVHVVDKLSDKLGLSIERISVWFQNRRAKYKKTKRPSGSTYVDTSALHANNLFSMASSASQSQQIYGRSLSDPTSSSSSFTLARANVDRATTATKECDDNDEEENEDENTSDIEIMAAASSNNRSSNNSSNSFISDNDNRSSNSSNSSSISSSSSRYATVNADINSQVSSSNEHINSSSINQSTTPLM